MNKTNSNKRGSLPEPLRIRTEGLEPTSGDGVEFVRDNSIIEESTSSATATANLIPEMNKFTLSSPYTLLSPLQSPPLTFINNNANNSGNNHRQAQIPVNQSRHYLSHIHNRHNHSQMLYNLRRTSSSSTNHQDARNLRAYNIRQSNGIMGRAERDNLIQANLRRAEVLRKQMQLIDYELFLITRNIQSLQKNKG